ncbi:Bax inhibitor-1/YccA family protein [Pseudonocardia sp.]|uniref:Bax inhibitor-1/YccA family protein n=1 Tax=Pseudonocardia sp. TaxID=60912 RepID=UPI003D0A3409
MRTSSNPAFRSLPTTQGGYAGFDRQAGMMGGAAAYTDVQSSQAGYGRADVGERPITIDDIVQKTAITAGAALVAGVLTAVSGLYVLALPAFIVGFIVSLVLIFKQHLAKAPMVLLYSVCMGVALGGISGLLNAQFPGIAFQAVVGTAGVFFGMLIVYKTGAVKVTPRFTKWLIGAMIGVVVLMLFNLVMSLFGINTGLRDGGALAIIFSLVVIGVAAFSLLLDFDAADQAVRAGAPARFAWYIAFGLMTTLVWLYIEILRLLSYLRQE